MPDLADVTRSIIAAAEEVAGKDEQVLITPDPWRPIETAPKDGTKIMIWDEDVADHQVGFWSAPHDEWLTNDWCNAEYVADVAKDKVIGAIISIPTHWTDLPPRPQGHRP